MKRKSTPLIILFVALACSVGCTPSRTRVNLQNPVYTHNGTDGFEVVLVDQLDMPSKSAELYVNRINKQLEKAGMTSEDPNLELQLTILRYNMRNYVNRTYFKNFSPNDYIRSRAVVMDKATQRQVSRFNVVTDNEDMGGTGQHYIREHADFTVKALKEGK